MMVRIDEPFTKGAKFEAHCTLNDHTGGICTWADYSFDPEKLKKNHERHVYYIHDKHPKPGFARLFTK